jgi:lipopolysaccharide export LptBFGC system permease protein LptF
MGKMLGRVIVGAAVAAVAMFIIGFIFFGTPLARLGMASLGDTEAAAVQQALAANLPRTGTYSVPGIDTPAQTNMYSQGPIATIHYNTSGFAGVDSASLISGLVLNFIVALLIGIALSAIADRVGDTGSRVKAAATIAVAVSAFNFFCKPIYFHHDWGFAIYMFVAQALMLVVAALILAWFLPRARIAPADAPTDV